MSPHQAIATAHPEDAARTHVGSKPFAPATQHTLADATAGQPARERAEGILVTLLHEKVIHTLVTCTADAAGESLHSTVAVSLSRRSCSLRCIVCY